MDRSPISGFPSPCCPLTRGGCSLRPDCPDLIRVTRSKLPNRVPLLVSGRVATSFQGGHDKLHRNLISTVIVCWERTWFQIGTDESKSGQDFESFSHFCRIRVDRVARTAPECVEVDASNDIHRENIVLVSSRSSLGEFPKHTNITLERD